MSDWERLRALAEIRNRAVAETARQVLEAALLRQSGRSEARAQWTAVTVEIEALAEVFEVLGRGDTTAVASRARAISSSLRRELVGEMANLCSMD